MKHIALSTTLLLAPLATLNAADAPAPLVKLPTVDEEIRFFREVGVWR